MGVNENYLPDAVASRPNAQVKVTATLTSRQFSELQEMANKEGVTVTEAMRRSIAIGLALWDRQREGYEIFVEKDGEKQRLRFL